MLTVGGLRQIVASYGGDTEPSSINAALSRGQVKTMFESALAGRTDNEKIIPFMYNPRTGLEDKKTSSALLAQNILRECG